MSNLFAQAPAISYSGPQTYTLNTAILPLVPNNTGGAVPAAIYGQVTTLAGSGAAVSTDGTGTGASFYNPTGIAVDGSGNVFVADYRSYEIRKITPAGVVTTFAGNGSQGSNNGSGPSANFTYPNGLAFDPSGNLYVADELNDLIRKITSGAVVSTLAGSAGTTGANDASGTAATFNHPSSVVSDASGNIYVADQYNYLIRKITPAGVVTTFAGNGVQATVDGTGTSASFATPYGITIDASGNLYVTDTYTSYIRKITPAGVVTTIAGSGSGALTDGPATTAKFQGPTGIVTDVAGNIYILDEFHGAVRKLDPSGNVTTLATGFNDPIGIAIDASGSLYVADFLNNLIRKVNITGYTISPALPAGLNFDVTTGIISGTPTANSPLTTYTITGYNASGFSSTTLDLTVQIPVPTIASFSPTTAGAGTTVTIVGSGFTDASAVSFGGAAAASFNVISDTEITAVLAAGSSGNINITAPFGSGSATGFTFITPPVITYASPQTYFVNAAISPLSPTNTGGAVPGNVYAQVSTFAGTGSSGSANGTGTAASFNTAVHLAIDATGNIYVADQGNNLIREITPAGIVTSLAGSGVLGAANGTGTAASFNHPVGVATDAAGNVYVADEGNNLIRKIAPGGIVTTFAGSGAASSLDGTGTAASFHIPYGLATDAAGNVYVAEYAGNVIRKITPAGVVTTLAGSGVSGSANGTGTAASFSVPVGLAVDAAGNVYVADSNNELLRKITPAGVVTTLAGTVGAFGSTDGTGTAASFFGLFGLTIDAQGNIYVTDLGNNRIRKVTPAGVVTTFTGSNYGYADGIGAAAKFSNPSGVVIDANGNLYVSDENNNLIRKILTTGYAQSPTLPTGLSFDYTSGTISGTPTTQSPTTTYSVSGYNLAGSSSTTLDIAVVSTPVINSFSPTSIPSGATIVINGYSFTGATSVSVGGTPVASFNVISDSQITAVLGAGTSSGNVSVTTALGTATLAGFTLVTPPVISYNTPQIYSVNTLSPITPLAPNNSGGTVPATNYGKVNIFAGSTTPGNTNATGTAASFHFPSGVATDGLGNVYVADLNNALIRKITPGGVVSTLAGGGSGNFTNGTGTAASFYNPFALAVDFAGDVYVADEYNNVIREITPAGVVTTFAGSSAAGSANATGTAASFNQPRGVAVDPAGNVYVADTQNNLIRKITPTGVVTTFAGGGPGLATNGTGTAASFNQPAAVATDAAGNVYVADLGNNLIRKITPSGAVTTLAGSGTATFADGTGTAASFNQPTGITTDAMGNVYVSEIGDNTIRIVSPGGVVTTLVSAAAGLGGPMGVATDNFGNLYVADFGNNIIRQIPLTGYTISQPLPAGLSFDGTTGIISGNPSVFTAPTNYAVTAYNVAGSNSFTVNIATVPRGALANITLSTNGTPTTLSPSFSQGTLTYAATVYGQSTAVVTPTAANPNETITVNGSVVTSGSASNPITLSAGLNVITVFSDYIPSDSTRTYQINLTNSVSGPTVSYSSPHTYNDFQPITPLAPTSAGVSAQTYNSAVGFGSGYTQPEGVANDAAGNLYVADYSSSTVYEIPAGGGSPVILGSGFASPTGVAVDAAGNVYVADTYNNAVKEIPAGNGTPISLGSGFSYPSAVAVDASGNVYVADAGNSSIKKIPVGGGSPVTIASGLTVYGIAVDGGGNVYVADYYNQAIKKILSKDGSIITLTSGSYYPYGVSVDGGGNVFFVDFSFVGNIHEIPSGGGAAFTIASIYYATSISVDGAGNIFTAQPYNPGVTEITPLGGYYIAPALPGGLILDNNTGILSGTPTTVTPATNYKVTAYNVNGSGTATTNITTILLPASDASLSNLTISNGALKPTFSSGITNYNDTVSYNTNSITVTPTSTQPGATITVNGTSVISGQPSGPITLLDGLNTITIVVTSPDASNSITYTINVTRTTGYDALGIVYVNQNTTTPGDGSSWAAPLQEFRDAVNLANTDANITQIWVAKGTYLPTNTSDQSIFFNIPDGVAIYGGFAGNETSISARNVAANPTILSGDIGETGYNSDNSYNVVVVANNSMPVVLDGFTITGANNNYIFSGGLGFVPNLPIKQSIGFQSDLVLASANSNSKVDGQSFNFGNSSSKASGSAFDFSNGSNKSISPDFTGGPTNGPSPGNSEVAFFKSPGIYNVTTNNGGGLVVFQPGATVALNNLSIINNHADGNGAGVLLQGLNYNTSNNLVTFNKCLISANTSGNNGGGVDFEGVSSNTNPDSVTFNNSVISNNTAVSNGGGLEMTYYGTATFNADTISGNKATNLAGTSGNGGGIDIEQNSKATFTNSTISGNTAASFGGGADVETGSEADFYGSFITNNKSTVFGNANSNYDSGGAGIEYGGAVYAQVFGTINNTTISGNIANAVGGGLDIESNSQVTLNNDFIINNTSTEGDAGGIEVYASTLTMNSVVFDGNIAVNSDATSTGFAEGGAMEVDGVSDGYATNVSCNNCVFNNNQANNANDSEGGAIITYQGNLNLTNCTFYNNTATTAISTTDDANTIENDPEDGDVYMNMVNTIVWGTQASDVKYVTGGEGTFSYTPTYTNSDIRGLGLTSPNLDTDPLFVNPSNPIGPDGIWGTADDGLQLACASPAHNTGTSIGATTTDIIGVTRGSLPDMGAYQQTGTPVIPSVTIASSNGADCPNVITTYTASPVNGGTAPTYQWFVNGTDVLNSTSSYTPVAPFNPGDKIYCIMFPDNTVCVTQTQAYSDTVTIDSLPQVTAAAIKTSNAGTAMISQQITAKGGAGSYTFTVSSGTLPNGINLASDGTLSGTSNVPGSYQYTIQVSESACGNTATQVFSQDINGLSSLTNTGGVFSSPFDPATMTYSLTVPYNTSNISFTPTAGNSNATINVGGASVLSGNASSFIGLNVGLNTINITVTAQDLVTVATYTISITRQQSTDATLSNLTTTANNFAPTFASGTLTYTADVPNGTTTTTVTPTANDANATITVNGTPVTSGSSSGPITLNPGSNDITIVVTAQDGTTTYSYSLTVTRGSFVFPAISSVTYGTADFDPGATSSAAINYSSGNTAVATIVSGKIHIIGAGSSVISAVSGGTTLTQTLTVTPATLTITADNQSSTYGGAIPALTASYSGFVNGDTQASLTTAPTITTTGTTSSPVGTYPITASGAVDNNYTISYAAGTLTIGQAALTITADNQNSTYGGAIPALTASYSGFVNGDTQASLTTAPTITTTGTSASPTGTYPITASGAVDNNYTISYAAGTLTIGKAALTITADNQSSTYGGAIPALTASYSGFVNGDTQASLTTAPTITTTGTTSSPVGTYPITASGAVDNNYTISYAAGTLTIGQAALTITADNQNSTYGGAIPALTASYSGFVNGDTQASLTTAPTITTTGTSASPTGTYPITASGAVDNNYTISYAAGTLTIGKAALTITADNQSSTYGGAIPSLTASYSGFVNGDTQASLTTAPTISTTGTTSSPVGTYPITASGAVDNNYTISYAAGTLTIGQAALTITADNQSSTYGGAIPSLTASYSGFVNGDTQASLTTAPTITTTGTTSSPVGTYPITASGAVDNNYTISYNAGTLTIGQAALTITADNQSSTYGGAIPSLTASYSGFVNGDTQASLTTAPTISTTGTSSSPTGTYPITASGAVDNNYTISYAAGTLTIGKAALTITADNQSSTYGGAIPSLTASYSGFVNGDTQASLTTAPTITTTGTSASPTGTYPITASGAVDNNYTISYAAGTLTIGKAALTITADNQSSTYGGAIPSLTASYSGFVNGDTQASLTTAPTISTTGTSSSPTGTYPITASGAVDNNYTISYNAGTLTIGKAALTITADNQSSTYGGAIPSLTATYSGFVNGDTQASLTTAPTISTTGTASSPVGTYPITAGGAVDNNYTISYAAGTLTIGKAALTITADNQSSTYGRAIPALTATYSGFVNGDTQASLTTAPTISTTGTASSPVGTYPITASGAVDNNYTISYAAGTLTIGKAALTITADNQSSTYGGAIPSLTASYSGFVNGDTQASLTTAPTISTTGTASSPVGTYSITVSGAVDNNYTISYNAGTLTIGKAAMTITADNQASTYGGAIPSLTASYSGFVNGDTQASLTTAPTIATTGTSSSPTGTYPITASGAVDNNYTISYAAGTLTIGKAALTITADNQSSTYGGAIPALTASYSGFVNGDNAASLTTAPTISTTGTASSPVGTYPITASGAVDNNYTISYAAGTLTIGKAALTITADNQSSTYGGAIPALTASYSGFVNGDNAANLTTAPTISTTGTASSPVGTYPITASGAVDNNYTISYAGGTLTIGKAALTITADNQSSTYGGAIPALTATYSGFVNGDTQSSLTTAPTISTTGTASSPVGTYPITASGAVDNNYTISYAAGTLTIGQAALTITADNQSSTYGGAIPSLTASYSGFVNGDTQASLTTSPTITTTGTSASPTGTYPITASGAVDNNYTISYNAGTLTIGKAALTITADNQSSTYGGAIPSLTASYSGFVNGDTQASLTTAPTISTTGTSSSPTGTYPITASGAVDNNYTISYTAGTLTIGQAALTITADNQSRTYGQPNPVFTATYSGFVNGDTPASLTTTPSITTIATLLSPVGLYPITAIGAVDNNYVISYIDGSLTINASSIATLSGLTTSSGSLNPVFAPGSTSYKDDVTNGTTTITVTPTVTDPTATVTVNGVAVLSGNASSPVSLTVGNNTITIVVTAQDGTTTDTYTIVVNRAPSSDATLANLTISSGTLTPTFAAGTTSYTDNVSNATTSVTVTPTVNDPTATITVNGTAVVSGSASGAISLNVGVNTITTVVTAQDGSTTDTYTIDVSRDKGTQTLTFDALNPVVFGVPDFSAGATISSGLPIVYTSSQDTVATIVNGQIHLTGVGSTVITASIDPNNNYYPVTPISQTLVVNKGDQAIEGVTVQFLLKGSSFDLSDFTSTSGLPLTFEVSDTTVAKIEGNQLVAVGLGTVTLTVIQAGNKYYKSAETKFIIVTVIDQQGDALLVHPVVTPNGDGINDFFKIEGISKYTDNAVTLVNRNGVKVYYATAYDNENVRFDGHSNITQDFLQAGTYFYYIEYVDNGKRKHVAGYIVLKY